MKLQRTAFNQYGLESLNTQTVQRRCAVQQHRMLLDNFFKNIPYFMADALDHSLRALNIMGKPAFDELFHHKGFEQLQCHFLWQAALEYL